tara:strand:- start:313 stop:501 length:189 start_codon:yes stop_codon:yes gene_type:complete
MSTYGELLEKLKQLPEEALSKDLIAWDTQDNEFKDIEYNIGQLELTVASDQLNDENCTYFVI